MKRELNEIEYFNWCVEQPYNMVVAVHIRGPLTAERLRVALDKAQTRHPLLQVNTELGPNGIPWFSSAGVGPIPLTVVTDARREDSTKWFERDLSATFARDEPGASRLPLLRVALLLPHDPAASTALVFTVQHVIADGLSMVFLVRDLLHFMAEPAAPVTVLDAPALAAEILPLKARKRLPKSALRFRVVLWLAESYAALRFPTKTAPARTGSTHHRSWELTVEQTSRLRARCRREAVSVQSAICTAFLPRFSAVHTPVNLRPFLARPVGESVGLFVGAAEVKMKYRSPQGFWPNARRFQRRLRRGLQDPFGMFRLFSKAVPVALVQQLGPVLVKIVSNQQPFAVTNLGDLDATGLELQTTTLKLESFVGAVTGIVGSSVLTVYTLAGRMRLHLLAAETGPSETAIRDEAERAVQRLLAAIDS
jgi:hypothetical protein